jgi:glycosyltransferase involved in cell wall biosynthesis
MACRCPIITSSETACPEIVGEAGITVNPRSVVKIARAIDCIASDEGLREEFREKGFQHVKRFSCEKSAVKTLRVIESLNDEGLPTVTQKRPHNSFSFLS